MSDAPKRTVLVTGAAGGIGRAMVSTFHGAGYTVIGSDRGAAPEALPVAAWFAADLSRTVREPVFAQQLFAAIQAALPDQRLDVLVNNAAVQILGGVEELEIEDWQQTLDVNLLAPFLWTRALLKPLERAGGCVINVSSIHARLTKRRFVAYATSKAALSGMTRAMAVDLEGRVRVNAIEPAAIGTDMLRAGFEGKPAELARLGACHPVGRLGDPAEVGLAALALAQGIGRFMHGACLALDGGISARLHDPD